MEKEMESRLGRRESELRATASFRPSFSTPNSPPRPRASRASAKKRTGNRRMRGGEVWTYRRLSRANALLYDT